MHEGILQTITVAAGLATIALLLGRALRIPTLLFFMIFGIAAGPSVLDLMHPESLGKLMMPFIELAVAIIIFEAALALPIRSWKHAPAGIRRILTITLPLTGIGAFLAARYIAGFTLETAALFGSLIVVTGPTVIGPLLKSVALSPRIESVLRWESIWADCIGVLASGIVLELVLAPRTSGLMVPLRFLGMGAVGLSIGIVGGLLLGRVLLPFASALGDSSLPGIVALTGAIVLFFLSNMVMSNSGVLSVAAAGIVTSMFPCRELEGIRHFKDQITTLVVAFLFVLLSSQIDIHAAMNGSVGLFVTAFAVALVIRPAATFIGLSKTPLNWREKTYIGFMGPRGIISAGVASYFAIVLRDRGIGIEDMHLLVFITIFVTGTLATVMGKPLAWLLRVSIQDPATGVVLAGGGIFASELAVLSNRHVRVLVVDRNPLKIAAAAHYGLEVREGDILSDSFLDDVIDEGFRRMVIMTPNAALNALVAHKAIHHFGPARTVVMTSGDSGPSLNQATPRVKTVRLGMSQKAVEEGLSGGNLKLEWCTLDAKKPPEGTVPVAWETRNHGLHFGTRPGNATGQAICIVNHSATATG